MTRVKTKIITTLLAVTMVFSLTACGVSQENLDSAVTPLSEQITTINATLTEMQTLDTTLDGYIDTLESKVATLETDLSAVNTTLETLEENSATKTALTETKNALETEINAIKADITALQTKDTELDGKITALQTALSTEITDTEKWVEETFTTKTACDTLKAEINESIATLQGTIDGLETSVTTLDNAVTALQAQVEENKNKIEQLEKENAELKEQIIILNCLNDIHGWNAGVCNHCQIECEHIDTVVTDNVCECDIAIATYTVQGATALLTIPSNVSTPTITSSMNAINSLETTTLIVSGAVNNEQYQLVKNDLKSGTALFFADITTNNYVAANGAVYSCEIGSVSEEKYVLIVNELKSYQYDDGINSLNYNTCISKLKEFTPGARAISKSETAWENYQLKIRNNPPSNLSHWVLADTKYCCWDNPANEWWSLSWTGQMKDTFYWYPVFDVPLK